MNLDVRRVWECPACGRRVRREGEITYYKCHCQEPAVWMRLIEDRRLVREYEPYIVPEIAADDLMEDEEPVPSESVIVAEAVLVEMIGPVEIESPLPEAEDFYSPEAEVSPPVEEPSAPDPPEPIRPDPITPEPIPPEPPVAESAPEPVSSDSPPETTPKEQPRTGKSRRRRSGRKRHRRPGSQEGG